MEPQFYTVEETASLLKMSKMTVYRYIKAGKFPAYKVGKDYRIRIQDFERFLSSIRKPS